jgi:hypothetical protein
MALLSEYKDIFGAPNTGAHSYRLFDVAIVDLVLTIFIAYVITYIARWREKVNNTRCDTNILKCIKTSFIFSFIMNTIYLLLTAIFAHALFGVNTKLNTILFGKL